ncbi:MAG TPA: hypothetical protein VGE36_13660 [Roseateles sp.]
MKRSGFKSKLPPRRPVKQIEGYTPRPRQAAVAVAGPAQAVVSIPKQENLQHQGYMAAVRKLPCYRCGVSGITQFCHSDAPGGEGGKGKGLKSDCRLGWPGCGPDFMGNAGCHYFVGSTGKLGKEGRRAFEKEAGAATRAEIRRLGLWPASLPAWPEDAHG